MSGKTEEYYVQVDDMSPNGTITCQEYEFTSASTCTYDGDDDAEILAEEEKINKFEKLVSDYLLCDKLTLAELLALKTINEELQLPIRERVKYIPYEIKNVPYDPYAPNPLDPFFPYSTTCDNCPQKNKPQN